MASPKRMSVRLVLVGFCVFGLVGCGESGPKTYSAKGKVTYKGQLVAGAAVTFHPVSSGNPAIGHTDTQGEFSLTTFSPGDGALAGDYVVTVSKSEGGGAAATIPNPTATVDMSAAKKSTEEMSQKMKMGGAKQMMSQMTATKQLLPIKYSKRETSTFKVSVKIDASANEFTLPVDD